MNDPLPHELVQEAPAGTYLVDAYEDWAKAECIPIHTGPSIDMLTADVGPWARFDANGAFCHVDGRCDFLSVFLLEIEAGKKTAPQQHLYEELCYVLSGTGETDIETPSGRQTIAWEPHSLISMPMNARYVHRNTGGNQARIAAVNDMRYLFNLFRNEAFIHETPITFPERTISNAVIDISGSEMSKASSVDGAKRLPVTMCEGTISADVWQLEAGTYSDSKRQFQGVHLLGVSGEGYTLVTEDGTRDAARSDWRHGVLFSAPAMQYYQHFNSGKVPARFLTLELGSVQYPMFRHRRVDYGDTSVYAAGRARIPAADLNSGLRAAWESEIAAKGVRPSQ
ncbi:MAG: hypothetical protein RLZ98_1467 [Pseudomonadota bacterium]